MICCNVSCFSNWKKVFFSLPIPIICKQFVGFIPLFIVHLFIKLKHIVCVIHHKAFSFPLFNQKLEGPRVPAFYVAFFISLTSFSNLHWYSRYTFCTAAAAKQIILPLMTALAAYHKTPRLVSWFLLILIYSEIVFICCTNAAALIRELLNLHTSDLL